MVAEYSALNNKRTVFINTFTDRLASCIGKKNVDINCFIKDCIILAKLESVYRSGLDFPDSIIFNIDDGDISDLALLIAVIDDKMFNVKNHLYLNPGFGKSSKEIGGADGDFIIDGTLVDIKVTKELKFRRDYFRQLCGYWWLDQRNKEKYGFTKLAIYFARYGYLFTFPVSSLIDKHNKTLAIEALDVVLEEYNQ